MWRGIVFVGIIMAAGTLFVLDASMPGGFVAGTGDLRYGQTMAFTTLMLFQIFNVLNARSDEDSAFVHLFTNGWLWAAIGVSVVLQFFVVYVPFLQRAFGTTALSGGDWGAVSRGRQFGAVAARAEQGRGAGATLTLPRVAGNARRPHHPHRPISSRCKGSLDEPTLSQATRSRSVVERLGAKTSLMAANSFISSRRSRESSRCRGAFGRPGTRRPPTG